MTLLSVKTTGKWQLHAMFNPLNIVHFCADYTHLYLFAFYIVFVNICKTISLDFSWNQRTNGCDEGRQNYINAIKIFYKSIRMYVYARWWRKSQFVNLWNNLNLNKLLRNSISLIKFNVEYWRICVTECNCCAGTFIECNLIGYLPWCLLIIGITLNCITPWFMVFQLATCHYYYYYLLTTLGGEIEIKLVLIYTYLVNSS